jgi:hypothetical protein
MALLMVATVGMVGLALSGGAWAQARDRAPRDLQPDLTVSIGLGCIVYLRTPPEGPGSATSVANGLTRDRSRPVTLEGTLTGVNGSAITLRSDDRVYWISLDAVSVVEFQVK